jgi:hypothetical protein
MKDLMTVMAFVLMVVSPCLVAMNTGMHLGADTDSEDLTDASGDGDSQVLIPG